MLKRRSIFWLIIIAILFAGYGFSIRVFKIFPYALFKKAEMHVTYPTIYSEDSIQAVNIEPISIDSWSDVKDKRDAIKSLLWSDNFQLSDIPMPVVQPLNTLDFFENTEVSYFQFLVEMEFSVNSEAMLVVPDEAKEDLILYHHGHGGDYAEMFPLFEEIIDSGYAMLFLSMPLEGRNNHPSVFSETLGEWVLDDHDKLMLIESDSFCSLRLFVEPVIASLNYIDAHYAFSTYKMIGLSGGGWTSQLVQAIDDRIAIAFPVAASVPFYLRFKFEENLGDYEQTHAELFNRVNYLELYTMGALGENRAQFQFFNYYDPCCFAGDLMLEYEDSVRNVIESLGEHGDFGIFVDKSSYEHHISPEVFARIKEEIMTLDNNNN